MRPVNNSHALPMAPAAAARPSTVPKQYATNSRIVGQFTFGSFQRTQDYFAANR